MTDDPTRAVPTLGMTLGAQEALARRSPDPGPIEQAFFRHTGRIVNKWIHYLPFYDRVLAPYRGRPLRMLEIGVSQGGSLEVWRDYFGPDLVLFGVDIDPACATRVTAPNQVRIGSQADADFLRGVVNEMGGVDIVLDDGSHVGAHQQASFAALWPRLSAGGLYMIEDLQTAYLPRWGGGLRRPGTAIELVKQLIDDQHAWYYDGGSVAARRDELGAIIIEDSIVAIEKRARKPHPGHAFAGRGEPQS